MATLMTQKKTYAINPITGEKIKVTELVIWFGWDLSPDERHALIKTIELTGEWKFVKKTKSTNKRYRYKLSLHRDRDWKWMERKL